MMRLIAFIGSLMGAVGFLAGTAGFFIGRPDAVLVLGVSATLFGGTEVTKWLQKMQENKE